MFSIAIQDKELVSRVGIADEHYSLRNVTIDTVIIKTAYKHEFCFEKKYFSKFYSKLLA